jgi:hypothetical protein
VEKQLPADSLLPISDAIPLLCAAAAAAESVVEGTCVVEAAHTQPSCKTETSHHARTVSYACRRRMERLSDFACMLPHSRDHRA